MMKRYLEIAIKFYSGRVNTASLTLTEIRKMIIKHMAGLTKELMAMLTSNQVRVKKRR